MFKEVFKPDSIDSAITMKKTHGTDALYLGGGTRVNHGGSVHTATKLICLSSLNLNGIESGPSGTALGSGVTLQRIVDSREVPEPIREAAALTFSRNIRNLGTLGGAVAAASGDDFLVPCLVALNAKVETADFGILSVLDYVTQRKTNLILRITVPFIKGTTAIRKVTRSAASFPVVSSAVRLIFSGSKILEAFVVLTDSHGVTKRLSKVEDGLVSGSLPTREAVEAAAALLVASKPDILGSEAYKNYIASVIVADCVETCKRKGLSL